MNHGIVEQGEPRLLIDYDWTLFDTTAFSNDLWQELANQSGKSFKEVETDGEHLHVDPVLGGYAFDDHIALYGLDSVAMWARLHEMITSKNYLYDDSAPFIQNLRADGYDPHILSFGEDRYQRVKITPNLSRLVGASNETQPQKNGLAFNVVFQKKSQYITEIYPDERGVLVDDVSGQNLPEGFTEIHLDRARNLPEPLEMPGGFVVASLIQALQVIKSL